MLDIRITKFPRSAAEIGKQFDFGTARGITKSTIEGKNAVIGAMRGVFTIRNNWLTSPIGPKAKPANKNDSPIKGVILVDARFLPIHETGGTKIPYRNYIAVPTSNAQPDKSRRIAQKNLPKNLVGSFILTTSNGTKLLCIRRTKGRKINRGIVPMYVLTKAAKEKKVDIFEVPIRKVLDRRLGKNISESIADALRTAR